MKTEEIAKSIYEKYRNNIKTLLNSKTLLQEEIYIEEQHLEGAVKIIVNPEAFTISEEERAELTEKIKNAIILLWKAETGEDLWNEQQ